MAEGRGVYRIAVGTSEEKRSLGRFKLHGRIILIWIFRKWDVGAWTGFSWVRIGTGVWHL
jgi:hypothetical protein